MTDWRRFNDQFRETEYERQERWRRTRQQRRERGECWQCGKKISACACTNVNHQNDGDVWAVIGGAGSEEIKRDIKFRDEYMGQFEKDTTTLSSPLTDGKYDENPQIAWDSKDGGLV